MNTNLTMTIEQYTESIKKLDIENGALALQLKEARAELNDTIKLNKDLGVKYKQEKIEVEKVEYSLDLLKELIKDIFEAK